MKYYIVRNWDNDRKYEIRTTDIKAAIRKFDDLRANGTHCDLIAKANNRIQNVTREIEAARAQMC